MGLHFAEGFAQVAIDDADGMVRFGLSELLRYEVADQPQDENMLQQRVALVAVLDVVQQFTFHAHSITSSVSERNGTKVPKIGVLKIWLDNL